MTYGLIDDHADDDERLVGLPLSAYGLYHACLPKCLRQNDDHVSVAHVWRVTGQHQDGDCQRDPDALVKHGLWLEVDPEDGGGWTYPPEDWARIAYTEEKRRQKAEAGRAGGKASAEVRQQRYGTKQPRSNAEADAKQTRSNVKHSEAVPVPVPVPTESFSDEKASDARASVQRIFEVWRVETNHLGARLTDQRRRAIAARMREGYDESDLTDAMRGIALDPWPDRRLHNDLAVICRDGAHVEKFRDLWRNPHPVVPMRSRNPKDEQIRLRNERFGGGVPTVIEEALA